MVWTSVVNLSLSFRVNADLNWRKTSKWLKSLLKGVCSRWEFPKRDSFWTARWYHGGISPTFNGASPELDIMWLSDICSYWLEMQSCKWKLNFLKEKTLNFVELKNNMNHSNVSSYHFSAHYLHAVLTSFERNSDQRKSQMKLVIIFRWHIAVSSTK